jgi:hypothetical protein
MRVSDDLLSGFGDLGARLRLPGGAKQQVSVERHDYRPNPRVTFPNAGQRSSAVAKTNPPRESRRPRVSPWRDRRVFRRATDEIDEELVELGPEGRFEIVSAKTYSAVTTGTLGEILDVGDSEELTAHAETDC